MSLALPFRAKPSVIKGLLAGLIGGLAGTAVKSLAEKIAPPRPPGREAPPTKLADDLAESVTGDELDGAEETAATEFIHWTTGGGAGAVYGLFADFFPLVTAGKGTAFGTAFFALAHEAALPALGLTPPPQKIPLKEHANEFVTHALYGFTVELVRRGVRRLL